MINAEILAEIARLEAELNKVEGTSCEVYSRVVGYFRPVKCWNEGKQAEYNDRVTFSVGGEKHG